MSIWPVYLPWWSSATIVLLAVLVADAMSLSLYPPLSAARTVNTSLPLGRWGSVELQFTNPGSRRQRLEVHDHHPAGTEHAGQPCRLAVTGKGWARLKYRMRPVHRGIQHFGLIEYRLSSWLGLWQARRQGGERTSIRVYPDFASVMKFSLLATDQRLAQMGILKKRLRGEGLEFHQLREYREGDVLRQIDWNATARTRRLISRDYMQERDQQIVFLVDCGRRMRSQDAQLTHFDHTLNAILLLSHVALRQGDAVGLMTFSGDDRWLPPKKSMNTANHILNNIYDLQPGLMAPDYEQAVTRLMSHQRRRALVILITNLRDEDAPELVPALRVLRRRHLVLLASMKEQVIEQRLQQAVEDFEGALEYSATQHYLGYRQRLQQSLQESGILNLDVSPARLPVSIVNRYLDIKSAGAL